MKAAGLVIITKVITWLQRFLPGDGSEHVTRRRY